MAAAGPSSASSKPPDPSRDTGYLLIPPDLLAEVVSPGDLACEVRDKVDLWLGAGVRVVWVVDPTAREVTVYARDQYPLILTADEMLTAPDILPGFAVPVAEIFS